MTGFVVAFEVPDAKYTSYQESELPDLNKLIAQFWLDENTLFLLQFSPVWLQAWLIGVATADFD